MGRGWRGRRRRAEEEEGAIGQEEEAEETQQKEEGAGSKNKGRGEMGRGDGEGGRRTKGREAPALEREWPVTQPLAPPGQCQCAQLRWLGDNCSSPGEKTQLRHTRQSEHSHPAAVPARWGTCTRCQRQRGGTGLKQ